MKKKTKRLEMLRMIISSKELSNQTELLEALRREGTDVTQATLSRDLKQLKVVKAATHDGRYVYVLPAETMYRRVPSPQSASEMLATPGFLSLTFSGNIGIVKTRPGYAGSIAFNIDEAAVPEILGTIAGDDTILIVISEDADRDVVASKVREVVAI